MLEAYLSAAFEAELEELDWINCEEWQDWKNDAESPKDLFPLRDFNKKLNCLLRSRCRSFLLFHRIAKTHGKESLDLKSLNSSGSNLFRKFIEVMIGLFYKIQSTQTLYLTLMIDKIWSKTDFHHLCLHSLEISKCSQCQHASSKGF